MNKLTMIPLKMRRQIIKKYRTIYQAKKTTKKERGKILDIITHLCGLNRDYVCFLLKKKYWRSRRKQKRNRPKVYDSKVLVHLVRLWKIANFSCGKLLKSQIKTILPFYEKEYGKIKEKELKKLITISSSTIDRRLKKTKQRLNYQTLKGRSYLRKKDRFFKHLIPIKTCRQWNFATYQPGNIQIDLVSHDGGNLRGDFIQTLNMIDYKTGWDIVMACLNKAAINVFPQLKEGTFLFPFTISSIHSDSGAEFINAHLFGFCRQEKIVFTRSRPYKKDDNFLVENSNNHVVRRNVGYRRYEGRIDFTLLNLLYRRLYFYLNFFKPQRRCIKKIRVGARIKKFYDQPQTSYQRVLSEKSVANKQKKRLKKIYKRLNPISLRKEIIKFQNILLEDDKIRRRFVKNYLKRTKKLKDFRLDFT